MFSSLRKEQQDSTTETTNRVKNTMTKVICHFGWGGAYLYKALGSAAPWAYYIPYLHQACEWSFPTLWQISPFFLQGFWKGKVSGCSS